MVLPPGLVSLLEPEAERRGRDVQTVALELLEERLVPSQEVLLRHYGEVCASHGTITDFRAKLLALLPIASGAAIGVLGFGAADSGGLLVGLGLFGVVVTIGLFMYEVRQIDLCKQLRNHAAWIERRLGITAGQFGGRRPHLTLRDMYLPTTHRQRDIELRKHEIEGRPGSADREGFIGAETAGYIIYHAVIVAWLALAVVGVAKLAN